MLTLVADVLAYDFARESVERLSERSLSLSLKVKSETSDEKDMVGCLAG